MPLADERVKEQKLIVLDRFAPAAGKTKDVVATLKKLGVASALIVDGRENEALAGQADVLPLAPPAAPEVGAGRGGVDRCVELVRLERLHLRCL